MIARGTSMGAGITSSFFTSNAGLSLISDETSFSYGNDSLGSTCWGYSWWSLSRRTTSSDFKLFTSGSDI